MDEQSDIKTGMPVGESLPGSDRWLNRNVLGMGLTSLLSDAGHEMATAILAGFLGVLGGPGVRAGSDRRRGRRRAQFCQTGCRMME
jgi:hypothetical protein